MAAVPLFSACPEPDPDPLPEPPADPSGLIAETEAVLGNYLGLPARLLPTWPVGDATFASQCQRFSAATRYTHFIPVANGVYEISCAASRLVIFTGGDWCAVPARLMARFDFIVEQMAVARKTNFRQLCAHVISAQSGNKDAVLTAAAFARLLTDPLSTELLGGAFNWVSRARQSASRMALGVVDAELRDRALEENARVTELCAKLEQTLHRIGKNLVPWDSDAIVLAQRYGLNSTRVRRRLATLYPSAASRLPGLGF